MAHDARAVANKLLEICEQKGISITLMQLIKLVHLSNGWWMTYSNGEPLVIAEAQAWQYGPVYPQVYRSFKKFGSGKISEKAINKSTGDIYFADFSESEVSLMESVVDAYGKLHAFQLSDMMHQPGTPWHDVFTTQGPYAPIPHKRVYEHFNDLRAARTRSE